jgi:hypothetical protein
MLFEHLEEVGRTFIALSLVILGRQGWLYLSEDSRKQPTLHHCDIVSGMIGLSFVWRLISRLYKGLLLRLFAPWLVRYHSRARAGVSVCTPFLPQDGR